MCSTAPGSFNKIILCLVMVLVVSLVMISVSTGILVTGNKYRQERLAALKLLPPNCTEIYEAVQPNFVGQTEQVAPLARNLCKGMRLSKQARHNKRGDGGGLKPTTSSTLQPSSSVVREEIAKARKAERRQQRRRLRKMRKAKTKRLLQAGRKRKGRNMRLMGGQLKSIKGLRRRRPRRLNPGGEEGRQAVDEGRQAVNVRRKKLRESRNKLREFWVEGEVYRDWKRKKSTQLLLQQPQAQLAVEQLWQQLIKKDDHFGEIYRGMHNRSFPYPLDRELSKEDLSSHQNHATIPHLKHPGAFLELKSLSE